MSALSLSLGSSRRGARRHGAQPKPAAPNWVEVADGLWTASNAVGFIGIVELVPEGFRAVDGKGVEIGCYDVLKDAKEAVLEPGGRSYRRRHSRRQVEQRLAVAAAIVGALSCTGSATLIVTGMF